MKRVIKSFGLLIWVLAAVAGPLKGGAEDGAGPIDLDAIHPGADGTEPLTSIQPTTPPGQPAEAPDATATSAQPAIDLDAAAAMPAKPAVGLDATPTSAQPALDHGVPPATPAEPPEVLDAMKAEKPAAAVSPTAVTGTPEDAARLKQEGMDLQGKGDVVGALKAYRRSIKIQADAQIEERVKKLEAYLKAKGLEVLPDM